MPPAHNVLNPSRPFIADNLCALAVMTKVPRAGQVKTRLAPPLTPEEAADLNICFLRDTASAIAQACGANARGVGVYTPVGSEEAYSDILPTEFELLAQRGVGFGERLGFAAVDLFQCGFSSVCLIDSDSPTVSRDMYAKAVDLLSDRDDRLVLGPSDDGGYYLIGMKHDRPQLFERIDWSTERVFDQTMDRARELSLPVSLLPTGYDVDDAAALRRLCDELLCKNAAKEVAPNTRRFLLELTKAKAI
jgi:rSAM/selenodomain-associated transferase 1